MPGVKKSASSSAEGMTGEKLYFVTVEVFALGKAPPCKGLNVTTNDKPRIFISHIHEEAKLGSVLKSWIEDAFPDQLTVFLSSDPNDLPGGRAWLDEIRAALKNDRLEVLLSLISPQSLQRPWISIELGAGWIQDKTVIPFCHSGIRKGALPRPLGDFVAIELEQDDCAKRLLDAIASTLKLRYSSKLPLEFMRKEMRDSCAGLPYPASVPSVAPQDREAVRLEDEEILILQMLCTVKDNSDDRDVLSKDLALMVGLPLAKLEWRMNRLMELNLAHDSHYGKGRHFYILDEGTDVLIKLDKYPP
jgi:hypothetical protein